MRSVGEAVRVLFVTATETSQSDVLCWQDKKELQKPAVKGGAF